MPETAPQPSENTRSLTDLSREGRPVDGRALAAATLRRLWSIYFAAMFINIAIGMVLFYFGLAPALEQLPAILVLLTCGLAASMAIDFTWIRRDFRPLEAALARLPGHAETAHEALVHAMSFPVLTVRRCLLGHMPGFGLAITIASFVAGRWFDAGLDNVQLAVAWVEVFFLGFCHAILEYVWVTRAMQKVVPLLREHSPLTSDVFRRIRRIPAGRKIAWIVFFTSVVPIAALAATTLIRMMDLYPGAMGAAELQLVVQFFSAWVVISALTSICLSVWMSSALAFDVTTTQETVVAGLQRVERGQLDVRLPITSADDAMLNEGFNRMVEGLQERERLFDAFGRFVAPEIAEQVRRHEISLGGETVHASILFSDIRGFTSMSEAMTPASVVALLNDYFAAMEAAVQAEGGWINKYGGDSIMAVFGTPVRHADHARRAVRAAVGMREALVHFNERQLEKGLPQLKIGIGVHTGEVVAGYVGTRSRTEFTVIGDVVNVASRLESLTKELKVDLLVSAVAYRAAGNPFPAQAMAPLVVRGKSMPMDVLAIATGASLPTPAGPEPELQPVAS